MGVHAQDGLGDLQRQRGSLCGRARQRVLFRSGVVLRGHGRALIGYRNPITMRPISNVRVTHMKTTIELPDELLERSKAVARRENSTLKALIEEGLRMALRARRRKPAAPFALQPFLGDGLSTEFAGAGWKAMRDEIYRDRG